MNALPLISIIIPVYNGAQYLAPCIESVLAQTYHDFELILIDDGSTDNTASVAEQYSDLLHYEFQKNSGAGAARNRGVHLAQGSFLAFIDADDLWVPEKLSAQMAVFTSDPTVEMVYGHVKQFVSPELTTDRKRPINQIVEVMPGYHVGTLLIKRDAFHRVGKFEDHFELAEFLDWYSRGIDLGLKSHMLPDIVMKRRIHESNQGIYKRQHRSEYVRFVKTVLDRRRKGKTVTPNNLPGIS